MNLNKTLKFDEKNLIPVVVQDAKDGAAGQCRASANSDGGRRERIPEPVGGGRRREGARAHITIKQGFLRFVKEGGLYGISNGLRPSHSRLT